MNKLHKSRLVLACVALAIEAIRLALVLLNMANNYSQVQRSSHASEMV
jgi:hypothetical protein